MDKESEMGGERHPDGVGTFPATADDLATYDRAQQQLSEFSAPVLMDRESPDHRMFLAAFDGTGNSMFRDDPENHTNVARIFQQIEERQRGGEDGIGAGYVEGVGTQGGLGGTRDLISGRTYEARLEEMYLQFITQSQRWLKENPGADIRLASIGFSRGAEQAAGFTRIVEERGIQNPEDAVVKRDSKGLIESVEFTRPPLREPGSVIQAIGLFDPVGTGTPYDHDRRLAPSVVSGLQITAEHERRNLFLGTRITDPGMTMDGRFLNVEVAGAHSNIGGSYRLDGLSIRSGNLMTDYLNSLSSEPFLEKRGVRPDPERDVIHRSEDHQFFYRTSKFDRQGERVHQEELAPPALCRIDCRDAMPRNEAMAAGLAWRQVEIGPVPDAQRGADPTVSEHGGFVQRLLEQAKQGNGAAIDNSVRDYLNGEAGQAWLQQGQQQLREMQQARLPDAQVIAQQAPEIGR
ncbi:DUF2235 domain-containing protein [Luteimonas sp. BDR2-5]|uniref:T6SS phospholipase effector Tle1-like catalytic domain-containing protein n=1 Tax=Proluteimonas luteida TaxID=2878685 RepID=UPI001E2FD766|nr:DUF2235 domain-containing protein [Luteimonas sp. BDR2-5]MCD9028991.1 DUF2235 domain-containing protein [Luteimonas sp. BDR2-5]